MEDFLDFLRSDEFSLLPPSERLARLNRFLQELDGAKRADKDLKRPLELEPQDAALNRSRSRAF